LALAVALAAAIGCATLFASGPATEGTFSHKFHLEAFVDLSCEKCHTPIAGEAAPGKYMTVVDMNLCARCHDPARSPDLRLRAEKFLEPRRVGTFDHGEHQAHTKLDCVACHTSIRDSRAASEHHVPRMETCWTCHAKLTTLQGESGARCSLCHTASDVHGAPEKERIFAEVIANETPPGQVPAAVMPPAHAKLLGDLWRGEIAADMAPADHTEMFRTETHGRRSRAPDAKCYACHFTQECQSCHQGTRPADHTLRFDRAAHGRLANQRSERCAACHHADFCAACHEVPPPGHTLAFRKSGAHAAQARGGVRSCMTCHDFGDDCAACHNR
jgi:predicted CXXCH cytochrome family protein